MSPSEIGADIIDGSDFSDALTTRENVLTMLCDALVRERMCCWTCDNWNDSLECCSNDSHVRHAECDVCSWWSERRGNNEA